MVASKEIIFLMLFLGNSYVFVGITGQDWEGHDLEGPGAYT